MHLEKVVLKHEYIFPVIAVFVHFIDKNKELCSQSLSLIVASCGL